MKITSGKQMAKKKEEPKNNDTTLIAELIQHYSESEKYLAPLRDDADFSWDDRENMLVGILTDSGSKKTKSKINTQDLVNLVLDGASRVMAQFPTGTMQALTKDDKGKNIMMNLVHEKYIIPNADSQFDYLTKLRIWDIYSRVFGSMPALVDYRVDDDYIGPDLWLIHPRAFFPQAGHTNLSQMAHCQVSTWVNVEYLKTRDKKVWKNIDELIKNVKEGTKSKQSQDSKYLPVNERLNGDLQPEKGEFAECELLTEYRKDRWITYSKEFSIVVRDIPNPQDNDELPIVMKHCFPLLDRLYGLAEFERGHSLQKAANSLVNLYFEGVQMSIFPPLIIDQNGVVASTIEYKAKAKWLITKANAIGQLQLSPQGMNTFNSTYSFLKSQMLNLGATTDTSVNSDQDPSMGKTPEALKMQGAREGARDNWDRFMMEQALEKVTQKFIDLLTTKQEKPIEVNLFASDIKKLKESYPNEDIATVFGNGMKTFSSGQAGQMTVGAKEWKEGKETIKFKYFIDPGSTMKADDTSEHQALTDTLMLIMKIPGAMDQIAQTGKFVMGEKTFDFSEAMKRYVLTGGIQDGEKIVSDNHDDPNAQQKQDSQAQQGQQIAQLTQLVQQITQKLQEVEQKATQKNVKAPSEMISYKDASPFIKSQMEAQAGMQPDPIHSTENVKIMSEQHKTIHQNINPIAGQDSNKVIQ